jgi:hypothetical protein
MLYACRHWPIIAVATLMLLAMSVGQAVALDQITIKRDNIEQVVSGRTIVAAQDGGLLVQSADGVLWSILPEEILLKSTDDKPFVPMTGDELGKQLLKQLPKDFELYTTANYVILHNTSKPYAQWCGALFEQLYKVFTNYWNRRGFDLHKPEFPMVAIVFADQASYAAWSKPELGDAAGAIIGYYSLLSNRMTMYDLTGVEALRRPGNQRTTAEQINAMLSQPQAERTVATVIHEATHQVALNTGLQTRYADVPLWVSEGIAVYFETPDMKSLKGWGNIGGINRVRLNVFRDYMSRRPAESLESLLADDKRFRDTRTGNDAYAEAWALNYFLLTKKSKQYYEYTAKLAKKPVLVWDKPESRLEEFKASFGGDLKKLDAEFIRYMATLR